MVGQWLYIGSHVEGKTGAFVVALRRPLKIEFVPIKRLRLLSLQ